MANVRIHELAKQLGRPSKEFVEELKKRGFEVKSYMSTVDEETAKLMTEAFAPKKKAGPKAKEKEAKAPAEKTPAKAEKKTPAKAKKKAPEKAVKEKEKPAKGGAVVKAKAEPAVEKPTAEVKAKPKIKAKVKEEVKTEAKKEAQEGKAARPRKASKPREAPQPEAAPVATAVEEPPVEEVPEEVEELLVEEVPVRAVEPPVEEVPFQTVTLAEAITVKELAEKLEAKANDVIKTLMQMGQMANINQVLDFDTAKGVAENYGFQAEMTVVEVEEEVDEEVEEALEPRPPVVTVMGHVDHGKTRLLDSIRETNVAEKETGGITQHIGASVVEVDKGRIVFLDTPGHEAFTAMRARGAQVTDIVILVVAADDGVMPQTREAIAHATAGDVPMLVAINKIDKPDAQPERVKQQLTELKLVPEDWGGDTIFCEVSAKEKIGIDELLEMILLQAEIMELKANIIRQASGTIIEAKLDKGRGPVCTVLVKEGILKVGDSFVCGLEYGKVRAMFSDHGKRIHEATPSIPVEVLGLSDVPKAGDVFQVVEEERKARQIGALRQQKHREEALSATNRITLDDLYERIKEGEIKELNMVLKADVHGSLQAISEALEKLSTEEVKVNIIHGSVGGIRETDIGLASASEAVVIGFNVRPTPQALEMIERETVDVRLYSVIYDLISEVRAAMEGLLDPVIKEVMLGRADVRETFNISHVGTIAGCYITDGIMRRDAKMRIIRDDIVVYEGKMGSLRRFKEDVQEVSSGYECGVNVEGYNDIKMGDVLEAFELQEVSKKL